MGNCVHRSSDSSLIDKEVYIAEGKGGRMTHVELRSLKIAVLDKEKEYNKKWAKIDEHLSDSSTLWLDLIAEDHSKLTEVACQYQLPDLFKLNLSNAYASKSVFQKLLLNSMPVKLQELQITTHEFETNEIGSTHKLLLQ